MKTIFQSRAMRNPSDGPDPHQLNLNYWYTLVCRLLFVVVFEVQIYNQDHFVLAHHNSLPII